MAMYLHSPSGSLRVTTPAEVGSWLRAFDPATFAGGSPAPAPPQAAQLAASTSTADYELLLELAAHSASTAEEFLGRPSFRHVSADGSCIVTTPSRQLAFVFDDVGVRVVGPSTHQVAMSTGVVAAAWLQERARRAGWLLVHGSCFVLDGVGVLCLGDKGSGKSALAMVAGSVLGAEIVANDRCLVRVESGAVCARALPQVVALGFGLVGALGLSPAVSAAAHLGMLRHPSVRGARLSAALAGRRERLTNDEGLELKLPLLVAELTDLSGVKWRDDAIIHHVLRPTMLDGASLRAPRLVPAELGPGDLLTDDEVGEPAAHFLGRTRVDAPSPTSLASLQAWVFDVPRTVYGCVDALRSAVGKADGTVANRLQADGCLQPGSNWGP